MGSWASPLQSLYAGIKLPLVILLTTLGNGLLNGMLAPLLGLNGHVIKAHGAARERAIMNAIRVSTQAIQHHINDTIQQEVMQANQRLAQILASAPTPVHA